MVKFFTHAVRSPLDDQSVSPGNHDGNGQQRRNEHLWVVFLVSIAYKISH